MKPLIFDIETAPLPLEQLQAQMPEFEAAGNLKDPEKIKASIESKQQAWLDDAALSPVTGRVLVIGFDEGDSQDKWYDGDERAMLELFWRLADGVLSVSFPIVGFNCNSFDLPFLIKRSWALGAKVPRIIGGWSGRYWNWNENIIDLRLIWQMGDKQCHGSLDTISRHMGLPGKTGNGKDFAGLWSTDQAKALSYLHNDLALTKRLYEIMLG